MSGNSYEMLVALTGQVELESVKEEVPCFGYHFYLSYNGLDGHHVVFTKDGKIISVVRAKSGSIADQENLRMSLIANGGLSSYTELAMGVPIPKRAMKAFTRSLNHPSVRMLVQAIAIDIMSASKQNGSEYIARFINQARLPIRIEQNGNQTKLYQGTNVIVTVYENRTKDLTNHNQRRIE